MSARPILKRQWIPIVGGSCDVRMGYDALEEASSILASSVGKPKRCVGVLGEATSADLRERLRRQLVDAGFEVSWHEMVGEHVRTLAQANQLAQTLLACRLTADDLCCALGDADLISVASHVCATWCGGVSLVAVPTSEVALLEGALHPRSLDVGDATCMVAVRPQARRVIFDDDLALSPVDSEEGRHLRALMVAAAMAASERDFSALWDRAEALMADEVDALTTQVLATAKTRGQMSASTAVAVRQAMGYGQLFARVVARLVDGPVAHSVLLAEGMRFAARLSVALDKLSVDDMLAQDELLEALDIGVATCSVDAAQLVRELKRERFARTNRFMLLVPLAIGRVRLMSVPDDLLAEHSAAWCAAHRP